MRIEKPHEHLLLLLFHLELAVLRVDDALRHVPLVQFIDEQVVELLAFVA